MNSSERCHEVQDVPGLYVDAFRGRLLRKTNDPKNCFILTHYHGDHYQNLPKEGKYLGPAVIHCSPATAELLKAIHQVPPNLIASHEYGSTFEHELSNITFYDANHCPGACIVLIQLPNGNAHLHTGDMRYCKGFQSYPLLKEVVEKKKIDLVYLDTTYSHPKHDFVPQAQAVEAIASQTEALLSSTQENVLVLLSCYSIGKEKVLWEAATRTNQKLYVSDRKFRMLQCVQQHGSLQSKIIQKCTLDPSESDIHVIPMGLAGEMWPYFRPNYNKCKEYVEKLDKTYDKVVAFLPTGWANASKWNKKNAVSKKQLSLDKKGASNLDIEIRLISYSEHSVFSELQEFVQYLRPRKVIPTVYSDESDCRKIQDRFRHFIDSTRAKKAFFLSMEKKSDKIISQQKTSSYNVGLQTSISKKSTSSIKIHACNNQNDSDSDLEIVEVKPAATVSSAKGEDSIQQQIDHLVGMGFDRKSARQSLEHSKGDLQTAIEAMLSGALQSPAKKQRVSPGSSHKHIASFFSRKY